MESVRFAANAPNIRHGAIRPGFHLERGMRVGLFGGSFSPAHEGHAHVAETARIRLKLDRVIWLVARQNPLKSPGSSWPLATRMAEIKPFAGPHDIISDFETRIEATYTIDTLRALRLRFSGVHFVWIMGSDSLASFHRWRGWRDIAKMMPHLLRVTPRSVDEQPLFSYGQTVSGLATARTRRAFVGDLKRTGLGLP